MKFCLLEIFLLDMFLERSWIRKNLVIFNKYHCETYLLSKVEKKLIQFIYFNNF